MYRCARPSLYAPPTRSRNLGAAAARGDYLVHLDSDMALAPGVLGAAVLECSEAGHVALVLEEVDLTNGFWGKCKALERRAYRRSDVIEGARFVRADVFEAAGGYDETLGSGEDWDIHARYARNGSIGRLPDAVHHHLGRISYPAQIQKKYAYGRSAGPFLSKHGSNTYSRAMASAYRRSWRMFARDPVHSIGVILLRLGEVAALGAGLVVASVARRRSLPDR